MMFSPRDSSIVWTFWPTPSQISAHASAVLAGLILIGPAVSCQSGCFSRLNFRLALLILAASRMNEIYYRYYGTVGLVFGGTTGVLKLLCSRIPPVKLPQSSPWQRYVIISSRKGSRNYRKDSRNYPICTLNIIVGNNNLPRGSFFFDQKSYPLNHN